MAALADRQENAARPKAAALAKARTARRSVAEVVKITPEDVQQLQANPSPETRTNFAGKFGQQYDDFIDNGSQEFANAILHFLAKDVEETVRQALAESIAESPNLPADLAVDLASDAIAIARPVLERSPVLEDDRLGAIIRSKTMHYAHAIAGREMISEDLSDSLIDSKESEVIVRLIANDGAQISDESLCFLAEKYQNNAEIQDRLAQRPNLPPELVDHMLDVIGEELGWDLVANRSIDPAEARRLVTATKDRSARTLAARGETEKPMLRSLHERMAAGDLTALDILGFLRDTELSKFEAALAMLAKLDRVKTRHLLYNMDKRCLAVLGLRAGLGTPQYLAIRMALDLADRGVSEVHAQRAKYPAKTARFVQEQYDRIRKDEKLIRQMVQ